MQNVVLIIHLILALSLIGAVLLQRSEGGGLGMGGGGNTAAGRPPATALGKLTWMLAIAFIITSLSLNLIAAENSSNTSVVDRSAGQATEEGTTAPSTDAEPLLPPSADDNTPLVPSLD